MPATLFTYLQDTQRLVRESRQDQLNPADIVTYINKARREVALASSCIRVLTPVSGQIKSLAVTTPGAGYSSIATLVISGPDFPSGRPPFANGAQATGSVTITGGTVSSASVVFGGQGYFQPTFSVVGGNGSGAVLNPTLTFINELLQGQEVYPFSAVDLSAFPGVQSIYKIQSVSIIYSNYRYSLPCYAFSTYQAFIRQFPFQYQWVPCYCAQFGRGTAGSFFMYPIPSQVYQLEWDAMCLPSDLQDDVSVEVLPDPYTDAVPFLACYYGYLELQNYNVAGFYKKEFESWMLKYGVYTTASRAVNPYGRY